jgi:hypothetical protein
MIRLLNAVKPGFLLLITAMLFAWGCTKQYDPGDIDNGNLGGGNNGGGGSTTGKLLTKITYSDNSSMQIQYNTDKQPSRMTVVQDNNTGGQDTYVYNLYYANNKLVEITGSDGMKLRYTYTGNNITKIETLAPNNTVVGAYAHTYGSDNRLLTTDIQSINLTGTGIDPNPYLRYELAYYPSGNLQKMTTFLRNQLNNTLVKTGEYVLATFDDKKNTYWVFENSPYLPLQMTLPNNPLTEQHYDASGQVFSTVTHTYTYDADGYPLTRKTVTKETGYPDETLDASFTYQ